MKKIRALGRLLYFVVYTLLILAQIMLSSFILGKDIRRSMRIRQRWARHLLYVLGVRIRSEGLVPDFPCILMSNHRSYLDPIAIMHGANVYAVSKAEVAKWPIIGFGAKIAGVLFLKRESTESRKQTLQGISEKVKEGFPVLLFPEGTTHSEATTRSFKPGGFKLAASEGFPIVPVAIDYSSSEDHWIGKDTFLPHFLRRFGEPEMLIQIRYGTSLRGEDPWILLQDAKAWIDAQLLDISDKFGHEQK